MDTRPTARGPDVEQTEDLVAIPGRPAAMASLVYVAESPQGEARTSVTLPSPL